MSGNLKAHRTPTNRRYYTEDQVRDYFHDEATPNRRHIAYARVSNTG